MTYLSYTVALQESIAASR